jgi:hypothetical protein
MTDAAPDADRPSDTEAAHAPDGGAARDPRLVAQGPRPDPLTTGMHGGGGRDRKLDYGAAPGEEDVGDAVRAPDDIEARVAAASAHGQSTDADEA